MSLSPSPSQGRVTCDTSLDIPRQEQSLSRTILFMAALGVRVLNLWVVTSWELE